MLAKELIHAERTVSHSSGPGAGPLYTSDSDAFAQRHTAHDGQEGTGVWPALPRVSRNARRRTLLQAADSGQQHQTQQDLGERGVPPCPGAVGDAKLPAQRLRRPFLRRRVAEEGGGI